MIINNKIIMGSVVIMSSLISGCSSNTVKGNKLEKVKVAQPSNLDKTFRVKAVPIAQPAKEVVQPKKVVRTAPRKQVRKIVRRAAVKPVQRGSWGKQYANNLTGDFSGNPQTLAFINKMSSKHGFDRRYLNYLFSNTRKTAFLEKMAYQDAFPIKRTRKSRDGRWSRYRNNFLNDRTINKGVQFWRQNRVALQQAERRFGVPQEYILGIIGVETRYGGNVGTNRAIDALSNMGFNNPRRGKYFQSELESYLLMTRRTGLNPLQPKASYAGALGLCQFMPSNIKRYGVDHDRSGSCNLWNPADAIGSVANYFRKHGWRKGGAVAVRAITEGNKHRNFKSSYKKTHSLSKMQRNGIMPVGAMDQTVRLLKMNTYGADEVWLAGHNFYVITRYNHSKRYAMAVHQLAQALKKRMKGGRLPRMASLDL